MLVAALVCHLGTVMERVTLLVHLTVAGKEADLLLASHSVMEMELAIPSVPQMVRH